MTSFDGAVTVYAAMKLLTLWSSPSCLRATLGHGLALRQGHVGG